MKKIATLLVAGAVTLMAIPANAQTDGYNRVSLGYDATFLGGNGSRAYNDENQKGGTFNGFKLQYIHGFHISNAPLYIETGLGLSMGFKGYSWDVSEAFENIGMDEKYYKDAEGKWNCQKMTLTVPVNIAYRIACGDGVSVQPYTGFHLGVNVMGRCKTSLSDELMDGFKDMDLDDEDLADIEEKIEGEWASLFDTKKFDKDTRWNRVQFGWQIGCGFNYKALYLGLEFGVDFNSLAKKLNTSNFSFSVGYNF